MKVLIVEPGDPPPGVVGMLARLGCGLVVVHDAESADDLLRRMHLDVVVARYHLDRHSGVWLLRQAQRMQPTAMRVLIGDDDRLDLQRLCANEVCHAAVRYPYRPDTLVELLAGVPTPVVIDDSSVVGL
jgi:DNA-binding NtrC family response regulator